MARKKRRKNSTAARSSGGRRPEWSPEHPEDAIAPLVAAGPEPESATLAQLPADLQTAIGALREALAQLCRGHYEEALLTVRVIGRNSPAAPWRLLLKGLCAYYQGEDEKARSAFRRLPPESPTARIARPWLYLLGEQETCRETCRKEPFLRRVCRLAGAREVEPFLHRCEILWQTGRQREAIAKAAPYLNSNNPDQPYLQARLLRFFSNIGLSFAPQQQAEYLAKLYKLLNGKLRTSGPLRREYYRLEALICAQHDDFIESVEAWDGFLSLLDQDQAQYGPLAAAIRVRQAKLLRQILQTELPPSQFLNPSDGQRLLARLRERIEELYQDAGKLHPDNPEIPLQLLDFYRSQGRSEDPAVNRMLDKLAICFPEDPRILVEAGHGCVRRKAYLKGLKYLQAAARLDPLNPQIRTQIIIAGIKLARKQYSEGKFTRARTLLEELLDWTFANRHDYNLSPALLKARWAVCEDLNGNRQPAQKLLEEARNSDPSFSPTEIDYFFHLYHLTFELTNPRLEIRLARQLQQLRQQADFGELLQLTGSISYLLRLQTPPKPLLDETRLLARDLIRKCGARNPPGDFLRILEFLEQLQLGEELEEFRLRLIRKGRRCHPHNLEFKVFDALQELNLIGDSDGWERSWLERYISKLRDLLQKAQQADNVKLAQKLEQQLEVCEILLEEIEEEEDDDDEFDGWFCGDADDDEEEEFIIETLPPGTRHPPKNWPRKRRRR